MSRKYRRLKRYGFRCREKLPYAILNFELVDGWNVK